jgi:arsenate reductase
MKPRTILFISEASAARSQMAEGIARMIFGYGIWVQSAASRPSPVDPCAVEVMREIGVELGAHPSRPVGAIDPMIIDTVITLGAETVAPLYFGDARRLQWPMPDVEHDRSTESRDERLARLRAVRDEIRGRVEDFAARQLSPA